MEELKIRAYGLELKVSGEPGTIKGVSKDFYDFLGTRISKDMERRAAIAERLRAKLDESEAKSAESKAESSSCTLQTVRVFSTSWEAIAKDIKEGAEYNVGDKVDCELKSGEEVTFVITEITDEHVRFESVDCVGDKEVSWSKAGNTKCGLTTSDVMNFLNDEIWNLLPDDLRAAIDPVVRKHKDADGNVHEHRFLLFLPAASEVFDEDGCYGDQGLYEQLEYYKDRRNRMRGAKKGEDTEPYWLASARSGYSTNACLVSNNGYAYYWGASHAFRVPVCFCIKKSYYPEARYRIDGHEETENEKLERWVKEHDNDDFCKYCDYGCDSSGVSGGPNGPIYPPCADFDDAELLEHLNTEEILKDIESGEQE